MGSQKIQKYKTLNVILISDIDSFKNYQLVIKNNSPNNIIFKIIIFLLNYFIFTNNYTKLVNNLFKIKY